MSYRTLLVGFVWVAVTIVGLASVRPSAQAGMSAMKMMTDEDYAKTMKQIAPTFQSLQKNNAAMNHADAAKDAQKLEGWFKDVQAYWEMKKADDAVAFAKSAVAAAQDTVKASAAMNMTALTDAQKSLGATCQGCHTAHREKRADGGYKIK